MYLCTSTKYILKMYLSCQYISTQKVLKYILKYFFKYINNQFSNCTHGCFTHRSTCYTWEKHWNGEVMNQIIQTLYIKDIIRFVNKTNSVIDKNWHVKTL